MIQKFLKNEPVISKALTALLIGAAAHWGFELSEAQALGLSLAIATALDLVVRQFVTPTAKLTS